MSVRSRRTAFVCFVLVLMSLALIPLGASGAQGPRDPRLSRVRLAHLLGRASTAAVPDRHNQDLHSPNLRLIGRSPKRNTVNSDLAFWGHYAFAGNFNGFRILDVSHPRRPRIVSDVDCYGPQNDVSVWRDLAFLSVDQPQTTPSCDFSEPSPTPAKRGFEGIRIIDVSEPTDPVFIKGVRTDCGSHTNTLVPDPRNGRVLLYVSSYALAPGPHCGPGQEENPLHGKISIVEVPLDAPEEARVIATPRINAEPLDLGPELNPTVGCHDIQVFLPLHIAAAACMTEGQIWDISDPAHPKTLHPLQRLRNRNFDFWHNAHFTWDGEVVVFGDETFQFPCEAPKTKHGRAWFYRVADGEKLGSFAIPRPQEEQYCSVHQFNVVPVRNRYILVSAFYDGGTSVINFTDPAAPREVAYYDAQQPLPSVAWSSYWYNGYVHVGDIIRGHDILKLRSGLVVGARRLPYLNPATQTILMR